MNRTRLPIEAVLPQVHEALAGCTRVLVQAPPGAGKSTLLPLALLDAAWLAGRRIVMLEPRRMAARAVAYWMAHLLDDPVGQRVGYRMRLESCVSAASRIEVITEGVLTRMLQNDPALEGVGCVIFDEFHERSLHADLGLALCLDAQAQVRRDLRILIMSATLDARSIAQWLGDAPVITAEGHSYPVDTRYAAGSPAARIEPTVSTSVARALREETGDALVFLPGAGEIRRVQRLLEQCDLGSDVMVLPLYGDLPQAEQERAIAADPSGRRKVVLATSIAETSLTIEGVRIVIDSGLARRAQFDPRSGMTRLLTTRVSRAAAEQRRGRAGRLAPGVCYRLWPEQGDARLKPFTPPEILEADLCPLALELANWGIAEAGQLRWIDPPPAASFAQARDLLRSLDALDAQGRLAAHGRAMAELGAHPRLAHLLVVARGLGAGRLAAEVAALLSERDLLKLPPESRAADLRLRLEALRGVRDHLPAGAVIDRGGAERTRKLMQSWHPPRDHGTSTDQAARHGRLRGSRRELERSDQNLAGVLSRESVDVESAGLLVALAYPDRIARLRTGQPGRYVLSNGRGATLPEIDPLAREEFLAIADLDAGEREARIYLAAPITRAQLECNFASLITTTDTVAWDSGLQAVTARRERRLQKLLIEESKLESIDTQLSASAMLAGVRTMGLAALPWNEETRAWQARVLFLRRDDSTSWPDVSERGLLASMEDWLAPWLGGLTRGDQLARVDLRAALRALLTREQQRRLDAWAPTHLTVPSGSHIALDYTHPDGPVLAARLQELFGLKETPRVAGGRMPVLVQLLSPAGRPVQTTRDLGSFWARGYHDVKRDLKGRYPKHYWPDDPAEAVATRRVRPR